MRPSMVMTSISYRKDELVLPLIDIIKQEDHDFTLYFTGNRQGQDYALPHICCSFYNAPVKFFMFFHRANLARMIPLLGPTEEIMELLLVVNIAIPCHSKFDCISICTRTAEKQFSIGQKKHYSFISIKNCRKGLEIGQSQGHES